MGFGETGFGESGFGESGFGESGGHPSTFSGLQLTTLSLKIFVYLHSFSSCCLPNLSNPAKGEILRKFELIAVQVVQGHQLMLAGAPKATNDKLQRLLNAAARLLSGTKKFDRGMSQVMHADLHLLDVPERVKYKLVTKIWLRGPVVSMD